MKLIKHAMELKEQKTDLPKNDQQMINEFDDAKPRCGAILDRLLDRHLV